MVKIKEGNSVTLSVSFYDRDGVLATPSEIKYRVDDKDSKKVMVALATVPSADSIDIVLGLAANSMANKRTPKEIRVVTIAAKYNSDDYCVDSYEYELQKPELLPNGR